MRVCIQKATGRLLEMQSDATEGTLIDNAVAAGFSSGEVEERIVTEQEFEALLAEANSAISNQATA